MVAPLVEALAVAANAALAGVSLVVALHAVVLVPVVAMHAPLVNAPAAAFATLVSNEQDRSTAPSPLTVVALPMVSLLPMALPTLTVHSPLVTVGRLPTVAPRPGLLLAQRPVAMVGRLRTGPTCVCPTMGLHPVGLLPALLHVFLHRAIAAGTKVEKRTDGQTPDGRTPDVRTLVGRTPGSRRVARNNGSHSVRSLAF